MPVARYSASQTHLGRQPVVVLHDAVAGREVRLACHGAALLDFSVRDHDGVLRAVAAGYLNDAEIAQRPGSRFAILAPFAGRVADARYTFDGRMHDLQPGVSGAERGFRHGFVRDADFSIVALAADAGCARVTLGTSAIRPRPGYPFAIDLRVSFVLDAAGLGVEALMRNVGVQAAPCCFGWHPYFAPGAGSVDDWELEIPAQTLIRTGADLIALPGDEAYVALDDAPALDFRAPRRIGQSILDQGYTQLEADADGRIRTRVRDPASGCAVAVWQERGVMHVFSADTLARGARQSLAMEPMEAMADAFNRPECAAAIRLEAGAERRFRCGVEVTTP